jgi:hypothetical protein
MITFSKRRYVISLAMILIITLILVLISMELKEIKLEKENVLYWGIIALLSQFIIIVSLFRSHKNLIASIKKVTDINDLTHPHSRKLLSKMGDLGNEIEHMVNEQNIASQLRYNRISALNSLVRMLCVGYAEPVLITDVNGEILSMSDTFRKKINKNETEASLSLKHLNDFRSDIPLTDVLNHLEKQKLPWTSPDITGVLCSPVFDKENVLNFCIWEFESELFNRQIKEIKTIKTRETREKRKTSVQNMFNKLKRKDKEL